MFFFLWTKTRKSDAKWLWGQGNHSGCSRLGSTHLEPVKYLLSACNGGGSECFRSAEQFTQSTVDFQEDMFLSLTPNPFHACCLSPQTHSMPVVSHPSPIPCLLSLIPAPFRACCLSPQTQSMPVVSHPRPIPCLLFLTPDPFHACCLSPQTQSMPVVLSSQPHSILQCQMVTRSLIFCITLDPSNTDTLAQLVCPNYQGCPHFRGELNREL